MKKLVSAVLFCLAAQAAAALEVTGVTPAGIKGASKGDFSFGLLTVKSVAWDRGAVVMPLTESGDRSYANIKLLSRGIYARLEACFKNGCAKPAKAPARPVLKVEALKPLKSTARVANAELSFDGELLVVAGVMASRKEEGAFWVAFPPDLVFTDPAFKSAVESAVIAAWTKKK
ncbi:MAG TPA: hypothetical protein DEQ38_08510 [Elusimicrobia bacterium]|nr:MAG: hypothetical protein A2089_09420 [Elusimicrobia bacterium GWD2_63_28]HCC48135.1 hypothetical protein [Elusimicrobiota bacterium]